MSYGISESEIISSDSSSPFTLSVNNNADIFNILLKPLAGEFQGKLYVEVKNDANDVWEKVYDRSGEESYIGCSSPNAILLKHVSVNEIRFTPSGMESGKSYQVFVENLSSWSDG